MARTKGSKNKTKEVEEPVAEKPWTPTPNMGDIKEPPKAALKCAHCHHTGEFHYGSHKNWCNVSRCNCQAFR